MKPLAIGDRVTDPQLGFVTVTFIGTERIGLRFEQSGQHALFKLDHRDLHPGWDESVLVKDESNEEAPSPPWPDSTFAVETADARHFMGSHCDPFDNEGAKALLKQLPAMLSAASPLGGFGEFYRAPRLEPDDWPRGAHLHWPGQGPGMVVTLCIEEQATRLVSFYPYADLGMQSTLHLERVRVWEGGVEAQIDARWGDAGITFFDTAFLVNRCWYEAGGDYDFLLAGIAYAAWPAAQERIPFTPHPDQIAWERMLAEERGELAPDTPEFIDFRGVAFFLGIPDWDADDYSFRGPVKVVVPFDDFLGQAGWKVRVTVMRFDDAVADLDIYITRRVWQGEEPPVPGQDIEGRLWLQGRLWSAPRAGETGREER